MGHLYTVLSNIHLADINNMFNPLKLQLRIKIIGAIIIALLFSFIFIKPKENDIPVQPISYTMQLHQNSDNAVTVKDLSIQNSYSPDYQTDLIDNYYLIQIKDKDKVLFTGKTVKRKRLVEEWLYDNPRNEIREEHLNDFILSLPYFKNATSITLTDDAGQEALYIDLTTQNLSMPNIQNSCGDGICTDNENLLMCYTDCKYLLPKWLPK